MANLEELVITLSADTKDLQAQLKASVNATQQATEQMAKAVEGFSKDGSNNATFFQNTMSTMAGFIGGEVVLGALSAAKDAVLSLAKSMVVDGVEAAIAQQDAQNQLNQAMARSGNYSEAAANSMSAFASQLQTTTKYEDDAVLSASALIESMAQLDQNGLQKATAAAVDLAAAFNMDLDTAARAVAKGMNGSTESLKKFGVEVQEGATKAETTANVLRALEKVSGAAAAQAGTYSGQVAILSHNFGEVQEAIGDTIVKNQAVIGVMQTANSIILEMTKAISENNDALKQFVAGGLLATIKSITALVEMVEFSIQSVKGFSTTLYQLAVTAAFVGDSIGRALSGDISGAIDELMGQLRRAGSAMDEAFNGKTSLTPIINGLNKMGDAAEEGYGKVIAGAGEAEPKVKNFSKTVVELSAAQLQAAEAGKKLSETLNEQSVSAEDRYSTELEMLNMSLEEKSITEDEYYAARMELASARFAEEQAQLDAARRNNLITETQYQNAKSQLEQNQINAHKKAELDRAKFDAEADRQRIANLQSTFAYISTLSTAHNKGLAAVGKAAAITTATIDGYVAVQKALASAPPPFNFALAAAVGVATAYNVAKISGVQLASGIDEVPGIGSRDNFPAILQPGERVVPTETNKDLKAFLNGDGGGFGASGPIQIELVMRGDIVELIEARLIERENLNLSLRRAA